MWELDYKDSWVPKNWCFWTSRFIMLMNTVQNVQWWTFWTSMIFFISVEEDSWRPLDCKEIKPVNPKGNKSWIFIGTEKAMAPHSSTLAWKIPWTEEPGRLQSMTSLRVGHDWATSLSLFTFMHWRRKWQPTPVFLPGESQRQGSLLGCCLWGRTESDTTEAT